MAKSLDSVAWHNVTFRWLLFLIAATAIGLPESPLEVDRTPIVEPPAMRAVAVGGGATVRRLFWVSQPWAE
jgi:hypothetical protein